MSQTNHHPILLADELKELKKNIVLKKTLRGLDRHTKEEYLNYILTGKIEKTENYSTTREHQMLREEIVLSSNLPIDKIEKLVQFILNDN